MSRRRSDADRPKIVSAAVDRIRQIETAFGVTRASLEEIKAELLKLASQHHLFSAETFPPPPAGDEHGCCYLLQEDPDGRFALYLNAWKPGAETEPHDHTTWVVVVAIDGQELNRIYRPITHGIDSNCCMLAVDREVMVESDCGIALMPDDIHSIHAIGSTPSRHLHMYGLSLERLTNRKAFDLETGKVFHFGYDIGANSDLCEPSN